MAYQIMENATPKEMREAGLGSYYTQHGNAIYPADANGVPWTAAYVQSTSDPITIFMRIWQRNKRLGLPMSIL